MLKKKIIRIKKKNPEKLYEAITRSLKTGQLDQLNMLKTFYYQSYECEDCDEPYFACRCEYCEDCKKERCICRLKDLEFEDWTSEGRNEIRKIIWEFARKTLTKQDLKKILKNLKNYFEFSSLLLSTPNEIEIEFLKSLTIYSKFPKYTPIMKEFFEIEQ